MDARARARSRSARHVASRARTTLLPMACVVPVEEEVARARLGLGAGGDVDAEAHGLAVRRWVADGPGGEAGAVGVAAPDEVRPVLLHQVGHVVVVRRPGEDLVRGEVAE